MDPRPVIFGEVLFDRFPDGNEVLGGAPFNVAWNLRCLGEDPLLVSRIGDDEAGRRVLDAMAEIGLDKTAVQIDPEHPTGTVDVSFSDGEPQFEIVQDRAWDHIASIALPDGVRPSILYHGSLALRSEAPAGALESMRDAQVPVFFDVNLRPPWFEVGQVRQVLGRADEIKLNEHELEQLAGSAGGLQERARDLLDGAGARSVFVTRGADGAACMSSEGEFLLTGPEAGIRVVDTVGAGDAFSSVLIIGMLASWPLPVTLQRAGEFASAVVGLRGATTTDPGFYSRFRSRWST
ncbi:carbohydrate kinase [bacterium]|nr:MAG: carbohydrate kinase [bacterium]RKZ18006.1 MAG: carbohydrate kinase [bacterium]